MSAVEILNALALTLIIGGFVMFIVCLWGMLR